ncbi:hypothetical protein ACJMK2_041498 [Sinanodonta woodiana]|uniref:Methyltransferase FkbM domain-containing protein n=1 Tax=Sinanodonta woodiana TaxID=1069815 RepID=A0ABD3W684_SINWO
MIIVKRRRIFFLLLVIIVFIVVIFEWHSDQSSVRTFPTKFSERDYVSFPVFQENTINHKTRIWKPTKSRARVFDMVEDQLVKSECVLLDTPNGTTPICIYDPGNDRMISSYVKDYGTWEHDLLNATGSVFLRYPELSFFDLGCNIGVYTLYVAKLGGHVVAVDAVWTSLSLLHTSVKLGHFQKRVTIIWNAVSDVYENVTVEIPPSNVGGAHLVSKKSTDSSDFTNLVETVTLNDFMDFFKTKKVFMKMDIEGYELRALRGGQDFFESVDVRYILMEWVHHRYNDNGNKIIHILLPYGFLPYTNINQHIMLNIDRSNTWPENVFWIKR